MIELNDRQLFGKANTCMKIDQFAVRFHSKYAVKHVYAKLTLCITLNYLQLNWSEPEKHWLIHSSENCWIFSLNTYDI